MTEIGDARLPQRFWDKVRLEPSGCWLWTANTNRGYGNFTVAGKTRKAHRISYQTFVGAIPDGLALDHLCRVRACVNPSHLEPVTWAENVRRGDAAKLAVEDVPAIRARIVLGDPLTHIAADYGVGFEVIFTIAEDERWRDDPSTPRQPLRPDVRCPACGSPITEGRRNRRYCSKTCIRRVQYQRSPRGIAAAARKAAKSPSSGVAKETR